MAKNGSGREYEVEGSMEVGRCRIGMRTSDSMKKSTEISAFKGRLNLI